MITGQLLQIIQPEETGVEQRRWQGNENGKPVISTVEPDTSFWKRLGTGLLRLLPAESQL